MSDTCAVTVIVPACRRVEKLLATLRHIQDCRPVLQLLCWGWTAGLLEGLRMIPDHLQRHKEHRREVTSPSLLSWLLLKRWPRDLGDARKIGNSACETSE